MEEIAERLKTEFPAEPVTDTMAALLARLNSGAGQEPAWLGLHSGAANFDGGLPCAANSRAPISWKSFGHASDSA